jgi:hypothetical protein
MDDVSEMEDKIRPCTRQNYDAARKELGLFTLNKMPRDEDFDVAIDGEGAVSLYQFCECMAREMYSLIVCAKAPWKVLTSCPEDKEGIEQIVKTGLLPKKTLLALLMVDFWYVVEARHANASSQR